MTHEEVTLACRIAVNEAKAEGSTFHLTEDGPALCVTYSGCGAVVSLTTLAEHLSQLLRVAVSVDLLQDGTVHASGVVEGMPFRVVFAKE